MLNQIPDMVSIDELVDIQDVAIDTALPVDEKMKSYRRQIKNERCFRYDDTIVRVSFLDSGPSLKDRIKQYLLSGQSVELTSA